uniref:Uncharacterized protein n=1 Tax=Arundo donax TaxID=35708 RepID=A0A0A9B633_ARUDO
MRRHVYILPMA